MAVLNREYGVGSAEFVGSIWLPHEPGTHENLSEGDIQGRLVQWLDDGFLPQKPGSDEKNLLFTILLPPEINLISPDPNFPNITGLHGSTKYAKGIGKDNLFYAVVVWPATGTTSTDLAGLTQTTSHELAEAFTDRTAGRGWTDDNSGPHWEISDLCNFGAFGGLYDKACPYPLSSYWRQSAGRCLRESDICPSLDVNRNQDGRLELFASIYSGLWHAWQTAPGEDVWSSGNLGTPPGMQAFSSGPAVVSNDDQRLEVFIAGVDGQLWHIYQTAASNSNSWSPWGALGAPGPGIRSLPAAFRNQDARLEAFLVGNDGTLWHNWQRQTNQQDNNWAGWSSLGTPAQTLLAGDPAVFINFDGRLEVFVYGSDGASSRIWHIAQVARNNGWSGWSSFDFPQGIEESPVVSRNPNNQLQVFLNTPLGRTKFLTQTSPGNWTGASVGDLSGPTAGPIIGPVVAQDNSGLLEIFVVGEDGALYRNQQTSTAGAQMWGGWISELNPQNPPNPSVSVAASPAGFVNQNGLLEIFVLDNFGVLWHKWQATPGGDWVNWEQLSQQLPTSVGVMSVAVSRGPTPRSIRVVVTDAQSNAAIDGATVNVLGTGDARVTASGITGSDGAPGTVILAYPRCVDRETKTTIECNGTVAKAGYRNALFITPLPP